MKSFKKFLVGFLAVTGAVAIATGAFGLEMGSANYWDYHGVFFLFFLMAFPRLTLLFSGVATGGILWWAAWIFAPRLLVAVLATLGYWHQNPILVVAAWLVAFGGESSEKYVVVKQRAHVMPGRRRRGYDEAKWVDSEVADK